MTHWLIDACYKVIKLCFRTLWCFAWCHCPFCFFAKVGCHRRGRTYSYFHGCFQQAALFLMSLLIELRFEYCKATFSYLFRIKTKLTILARIGQPISWWCCLASIIRRFVFVLQLFSGPTAYSSCFEHIAHLFFYLTQTLRSA